MIKKLEVGTSLIRGGTINYTDGSAEDFFFIVAAEEAKPERVVPLEDGMCLALAGTISGNEQFQEARERYNTYEKTGIMPPREQLAMPYYVKVPASEINRKTNLTRGEIDACNAFVRHVDLKELNRCNDNANH